MAKNTTFLFCFFQIKKVSRTSFFEAFYDFSLIYRPMKWFCLLFVQLIGCKKKAAKFKLFETLWIIKSSVNAHNDQTSDNLKEKFAKMLIQMRSYPNVIYIEKIYKKTSHL